MRAQYCGALASESIAGLCNYIRDVQQHKVEHAHWRRGALLTTCVHMM